MGENGSPLGELFPGDFEVNFSVLIFVARDSTGQGRCQDRLRLLLTLSLDSRLHRFRRDPGPAPGGPVSYRDDQQLRQDLGGIRDDGERPALPPVQTEHPVAVREVRHGNNQGEPGQGVCCPAQLPVDGPEVVAHVGEGENPERQQNPDAQAEVPVERLCERPAIQNHAEDDRRYRRANRNTNC